MTLPLRAPLALLLAAACSGGGAGTDHPGLDGHGGHGGDGGHGGTDDAVAREACGHLADGPAVAVAASDDFLAAPPVAADHRRHDVALVDYDDGTFGGAVSFEAPAADRYTLFLDTDVDVLVEGPGGEPLDDHDEHGESPVCPETVAASHAVPMSHGRHVLSFGPTAAPTVRLVIERDPSP